ncbi:MAG: S49 family peptidase [Phycisphaerales bacterium]|nr:S49 family peptidase [Phycisphaerales bacterium]
MTGQTRSTRFTVLWTLTAAVLLACAPARGADRLAWMELDGALREQPHPFTWLMGGDAEPTLADVLSLFDEAATRSTLDGLVIRIKDIALTRSQIEEIRRGMAHVREAGRPIYVFADAYGPGAYAIAGAADHVLLQRGGVVSLPGLYAEEMYLGGTLEWLGLKADFLQVGDFKGASEQLTRTGPSEEWSENIDGVLDDIYEQSLLRIMRDRKLSRSTLDAVLGHTLALRGEEAKKLGLIDAVIDVRELRDWLEAKQGDTVKWTKLSTGGDEELNFFALWQTLMTGGSPKHRITKPTVAVLHITGTIVDGESSIGGMFASESAGSRTMREALKAIEEEDLIEAVVVRIDSPGGSAMASEIIWQGLDQLRSTRPVYISVGSLAASGGYYCAVGGDKIFVNESSIVGSIGVVGGKIIMKGLYDKLHVGIYPRARGPLAGIMSSVEGFNPEHRAVIQTMMEETYDMFADHVTDARDGIDLSVVAEGRLFTGRQAIALRMADRIGGLPETIAAVADAAGLEAGEYDVVDYPEPESIEDFLGSIMSLAAPDQTAGLAMMLRELVGEKHWPVVRDTLSGLLLLRREPVLLISPRVLLID